MWVALKSTVWFTLEEVSLNHKANLSPLTTDAASQLDVLWHDGHTLGVDGTKVGIFEESDEVSLAGLLQSHDRGALESQVGLEVLSNLTDETLEGEFPQEQFR